MSSGAMTVTSNLNALNTQRSLGNTNRMLSKSLEKLSSGYRINVASDDPSGLIISEQLRTQMNGLSRASQNSQEACNVIGIAEGALIEMNNILNKMRALAIHAANSGVTAPDQVSADQAEVDSGIQTIERIASTTRYSDQFLLNGSKGLVFDATTTIDTTMNHSLLNTDKTRIDQVFKRTGSSITLNFSGINDAANQTQAVWQNQARRAYVEADKSLNNLAQIEKGALTANQSFILTGAQGSRQFSFAKGIELGTVVQSINNVKTSLGIGATLTFQNDVTGVNITTAGSASLLNTAGGGALNTRGNIAGTIGIYNLDRDMQPKMLIGGGIEFTNGATSVTFSTAGTGTQANALTPGINLDGNGRMYLKWLDNTNYIAYKDDKMTMEIGRGTSGQAMNATNNSGIEKANLVITSPGALNITMPALDDVTVLQFAQQIELNDQATFGKNGVKLDQLQSIVDNLGLLVNNNSIGSSAPTGTLGSSVLTGVRLGENTDANGKLHFKIDTDNLVPPNVTINVYKSAQMNDEDLVATGFGRIQATTGTAAQAMSIPIFGVNNNNGDNSGLYGTLAFRGGLPTAPLGDTSFTGSLAFNDLGVRLYTTEYGSQEYLRVQNLDGQLFGSYKNPESSNLEMIAEGKTIQQYGSDALIYVNGQAIRTQGLIANVTTPNYSGQLVFNAGSIGLTTIAQVGQDIGSLLTRSQSLQSISSTNAGSIYGAPINGVPNSMDPAYLTWITNARHATTETMGNFVGGMQYQLGEGSGDQERTVYAIPSMSPTNLGKITINGKAYTLQDVLAGGTASLTNDPIASMEVVLQAVNDVSQLRARLGAFQSNMLQTNINSLEVTVENITKTESAIRDADMAMESTAYTKNQILLQAGTSMLAQANQMNQNVLTLLGGR